MKKILMIMLTVLIVSLLPMAVAIDVIGCQVLNSENTVYILQNDIATTETCFTIKADNVTLDLNGFNITGNDKHLSSGVYIKGYNGATIKDGYIGDFYYGINLLSSSNNILMNITTNSNVVYGLGLYLSSNNALINIIANSNGRYGTWLVLSSDNNLTKITSNSNGMYGISLGGVTLHGDSDNNNLVDIITNLNGYDGINLLSSSNNNLTNITTNSNRFSGINLDFGSEENRILDFVARSNRGSGIYISRGASNTFINSLSCCSSFTLDINDRGLSNSFVNSTCNRFNLGSCDNACSGVCEGYCNIYVNESMDLSEDMNCSSDLAVVINASNIVFDCKGYSIFGNGLGGRGIFISDKENVTIQNCSISGFRRGIVARNLTSSLLVSNDFSQNDDGLWFSSSLNNTLRDITLNSNRLSGINLWNSSNNILTDISLWNNSFGGISGSCIQVGFSAYNVFENIKIVLGHLNGIVIDSKYSSDGFNLFKNIEMLDIAGTSVVVRNFNDLGNTTETFLNATYNNESVGSNSELVRKWYFNLNVQDQNNNSVGNANATLWNLFGEKVFSELTDINGNILQKIITSYINANNTKTNYDYNFSVTKTGYESNQSDDFNVSETLSMNAIMTEEETMDASSDNENSGSGSSGGSSTACYTDWVCSEWSECNNSFQTRNCSKKLERCFTRDKKPVGIQTCNVTAGGTSEPIPTADDTDSDFIAPITGAVIGNLGTSGTWAVSLFLLGLLGVAGFFTVKSGFVKKKI